MSATTVDLEPVKAIDRWQDNGHFIADVARLGHLRSEWETLDCTYGYGTFWTQWKPDSLFGTDLDPAKSLSGDSVDFTALRFRDRRFDAVVFDPPYKLNGTPTDAVDERYGVHEVRTWQQRMELILAGVVECARVLGNGNLLVKCQDQVVSGAVRWQTDEITATARRCGLGKVDRLDFLSYRPQPSGRRQVHARSCSSTLLVFRRGWQL